MFNLRKTCECFGFDLSLEPLSDEMSREDNEHLEPLQSPEELVMQLLANGWVQVSPEWMIPDPNNLNRQVVQYPKE